MIPKIRRILYATDLSDNSAHAFQYAEAFARQNNADLVILHVVEELPKHSRAYFETFMSWDKEIQLSRERIESLIERIKNRLRLFCDKALKDDPQCENRVSSIEVCEGYPAEEILKRADEFDCDVIVMGAHGKGVISHTFLGSVAEKVLRHARKPLFIIPLPKGETDLTFHKI